MSHLMMSCAELCAEATKELTAERDQLAAEVNRLEIRVKALEKDLGYDRAALADARAEIERLKGNAETDAVNTEWMGGEIDKLRAELDDIRADLSADETARLAGIANQNAVIDEFRAALRRYGQHTTMCETNRRYFTTAIPGRILDDRPCTCGLDAALEGGA